MNAPQRWKQRPEGSTWGDFGPDDQLGRLNLLTPEKVKQGVAEVREGLSFCLSLPLDYPGGNVLNPRRHPPVLRPTLRDGKPNFNYACQRRPELHRRRQRRSRRSCTCNIRRSGTASPMSGSLFDADGDGMPEPVYYNGYRAGERRNRARPTVRMPASERIGPRLDIQALALSASRTWRESACKGAA